MFALTTLHPRRGKSGTELIRVQANCGSIEPQRNSSYFIKIQVRRDL